MYSCNSYSTTCTYTLLDNIEAQMSFDNGAIDLGRKVIINVDKFYYLLSINFGYPVRDLFLAY